MSASVKEEKVMQNAEFIKIIATPDVDPNTTVPSEFHAVDATKWFLRNEK